MPAAPPADAPVAATVLRVDEYQRGAASPTAVARVPARHDPAELQTVRLPLTAEQHALLYAQLARRQTPVVVQVAYPASGPGLAALYEEEVQHPDPPNVVSVPLDYATLGWVLVIIGIAVTGINLEKYARHYNNWPT